MSTTASAATETAVRASISTPVRSTARTVAAIDTPPPEFPLALACAGVGGQTLLSVEIGAEGRPTRIDLVRGSGNAELDALASQAVQGWTFRPATRAGQPVPQTIQVPVNFTPPAERPAECFALDAGRSPAS